MEEPSSFVGARRDPQGTHGQAQVPEPDKAVVPVVGATLELRQRRGGGGDHRAGPLIGQGLKHEGAAPDLVEIGAVILPV